jgi:chromosome segregation ATPase
MRLAAAEQENEKLTEELQKLEDQNERAAQELLKDAEELTFMSIRMEELEREAEALKELNVKLVQAADQLAAMVGNDEMAASTATHVDHDLAALRMEADSAKNALATAEARAAAERSDLIARIRTLEIDLAEAESEAEEAAEVGAMVIGGAATAGAELEAARVTIEKLSALAKRRGDELMAAEAAASAAAREVASLKEQLANSSAGAGTGHLARVRELEVLMSEMLTAEEANVLEARIRELEIVMADMLEPEELDAALAKIRSLEIVMADMVDAEELEAAEARATQMEARAAALEVEADRLRARVRALEAEMAGMSYDEGENLTVAPAVPRKGGAFKRRAGQFTLRKFDFAAVKAKTTPAKAFKRSGTFSLRKMKFAPKASATSAAPTKRDERSVEEPVVFNFEQKKGGFKRTPGTFTKRKLSFEGAKVGGVRANDIHVQALGCVYPAQV